MELPQKRSKSARSTASTGTASATGATGAKTKRYLVAAALLGGGVALGATFSPVGLAEADTGDANLDAALTQAADTPGLTPVGTESTDDGTTDDGTTDDGTTGRGHGRGRGQGQGQGRGQGQGSLQSLGDIVGLSSDELKERIADGQTLAEIGEEQGISPSDLAIELVAAATERVDEAVAAGKLDATQADEHLADLEERVDAFIDREPGDGPGAGGEGRQLGDRGRHGGEVLESLGISEEAVQAGRAEAKTLAEIASEHGVSESDLVDALVADATAAVDEKLAEGKIDTEQAEAFKATIEERVSERVNQSPGDGGELGRRGHHRPHAGKSDADASEQDSSSDSSSESSGETEGTAYSA